MSELATPTLLGGVSGVGVKAVGTVPETLGIVVVVPLFAVVVGPVVVVTVELAGVVMSVLCEPLIGAEADGTVVHPPMLVLLVPRAGNEPSGHCKVTVVDPDGVVVCTVLGVLTPRDDV